MIRKYITESRSLVGAVLFYFSSVPTMKICLVLSLLLAVASALHFPLNGRIVGGEIATRGQFPYQAGLSTTKKGKSTCGGDSGGPLVATRFNYLVGVTSFGATSGVTKFVVWLGVNNVNTVSLQPGGLKFTITDQDNVITHAGYKALTLVNDIALIKLPRKIEFTEYIKKIDLPPRANKYPSYDNEPVVASGWGKPTDAATAITTVLQFVDLTVLDLKSCGRYYLPGLVKSSNICKNADYDQ
uniref:Peptidase S1 domain-containing protein n=1 Tax=Megaselia scalaris TaxID=36166 RepID=T1GZ49_MEGSC